jgi:protocatechuate 4,5-dioxygenase, beta chain
MAQIVGGIGSSHAPTIGAAFDKGDKAEPFWRPLFEAYRPAKEWLAAMRPDVALVFTNDHLNGFSFDAFPTFAIGVGELHAQADEGFGKRDLPDLPGHPELAWHLVRAMVTDEFDPTICQAMKVDHGVLSFLPLLFDRPWPVPVIPLAVNVIQHPVPTAGRLYRLGRTLGRAIRDYPDGLKVVVLGTGGLSHQLQGTRFGFVNPDWDNAFMDLLEHEPESLAALDIRTFMERGGSEGVEMILWLGMRAALGDQVRRVHRNYYAPLTTGYGLLVLECAG